MKAETMDDNSFTHEGSSGQRCAAPVTNPTMLALLRAAEKLAELDCPVLISGEPGTGKLAIAELIHKSSIRREQPFRVIDPSQFNTAVPTGNANKLLGGTGTVCFRDILRLSDQAQKAILKLIRRSRSPRVLATTRDNVEHSVRAGRVNEEFYTAISSVCLRVPALRARREDVSQLLEHFLDQYSAVFQRPKPQISADALEFLHAYHWPGNVAELEMAMKSFAALGDERLVLAALRSSAWVTTRGGTAPNSSLKQVSRAASMRAERELISDVLVATGWNRKRAAERLEISYKALLYKLKQIGLESPTTASQAVRGDRQIQAMTAVHNGD